MLIIQSSYKIGFNLVTQMIKITLEIDISIFSDLTFFYLKSPGHGSGSVVLS